MEGMLHHGRAAQTVAIVTRAQNQLLRLDQNQIDLAELIRAITGLACMHGTSEAATSTSKGTSDGGCRP